MNKDIQKEIAAIDLQVQAPETEPERQYYYIAKVREHVRTLADELGRTPTCCVTTFGCQMNARDSEKLTGILKLVGYKITEDENADFVIFNTCTVRDNANQRVYGCKSFYHFIRVHNTLRIGILGNTPDSLHSGIMIDIFFNHIHVRAILRHGNRNHFNTKMLCNGEMSVVTGNRAQKLHCIQLAPRSTATYAKRY